MFWLALFGAEEATDCETEDATIASGWIDIRTIEAQVVAISGRANSRRPYEARRASIVQSATTDVAGPDEVERVATDFVKALEVKLKSTSTSNIVSS